MHCTLHDYIAISYICQKYTPETPPAAGPFLHRTFSFYQGGQFLSPRSREWPAGSRNHEMYYDECVIVI